ncbi:MAG: mechanosensitive ion channel domain-containing protein [Candidatus Thermoplasmatota archaeon]
MEKSSKHISKLILWEIVLLFALVLLFFYMPAFIEMESLSEIIERFLPPSLIILFVLIVTKLFLSVLEPVFKKALGQYLTSSYEVKHTWQIVSYLIWISAFIVLSFLLLGDFVTMGVFVGLLILIFVLVSYKAITNFAGWIHIIFSSTLKRGDLVEIEGVKGKIIDVSTMNVVLEEKSKGLKGSGYTGRKVTIPNSYFFSKPIKYISSKDSVVWDEIRVLLPSDTDYFLAEEIMTQVAKSVVGPIMKKRRRRMIEKTSEPGEVPNVPVTEISLEREGVLFTLRYFCLLPERTEVRSAISEGILKEFQKEDIKIIFKN